MAAQGYRFARYGPIADVLSLQKFTPALTNPATQVIIEPKFVPIHRTDAAVINGTGANTTNSFPKTAGYEGIAVVADAASNTRGLKNGDWVYVLPSLENFAGTWCNKAVVSSNILVPINKADIDGNPLASALSCFLTAQGLYESAAASNNITDFSKNDVLVQNGGSSLTSLAVSAIGKQKGLKIVTSATAGTSRFAAAEKRHKAFGQSELFEYTAQGARKANSKLGFKNGDGARAFFNGVGGSPFNDFMKLAPTSSCVSCSVITYGSQHSFGLTFAGSNLIFKNISSMKGFYLPRYLSNLSEEQRTQKVQSALQLAKQLKGQYPVEVVKGLDGLPSVWDKLYLEGGAKGVIQF